MSGAAARAKSTFSRRNPFGKHLPQKQQQPQEAGKVSLIDFVLVSTSSSFPPLMLHIGTCQTTSKLIEIVNTAAIIFYGNKKQMAHTEAELW